MSKLAFLLFYSGFFGLIAAYTVKEVWLDRLALIFLLLGCWLHARIWVRHIESITTPVQSLVAALDLLNMKRREMDAFFLLMPNLFSKFFANPSAAEKLEFKYVRESDRSVASAVKVYLGNFWEIIPVAMCGAVPIWWFGVGAFHYERYYRISPLLHDLMTNFSVAVLTFLFSAKLTTFLISHLLRK